ncbi:MAG TPA: four helix bundle suffix domain-containing protein [Pirellulaceae bacterium]|nr:four helix bundle suffix domain-containing protein [Pirellulaceae bacterium]
MNRQEQGDEKDKRDQRAKDFADRERNSPVVPSDSSVPPDSALSSQKPPGFIPSHGGYQNLLSYQKAQIVFDATFYFCKRFLDKRDRTVDQMVQAARSGKQNIIEGSQASGTSKEMEIKLTNVARASLEELLEDYRDFLRTRGLEEWTLDHRFAMRLRELNRTPGANYETFRKGIENPDPAICANVIIGLIKVTNYLLDRQLKSLEEKFLKDGGLREAMTRARLASRTQRKPEA